MPIVRQNSSSQPSTNSGLYIGQSAYAKDAAPVNSVSQVVGLVPLFTCCDTQDAVGGFQFGIFKVDGCASASIDFTITLNGANLGSVSVHSYDAPLNVQNYVQAILPTGWTCTAMGSLLAMSVIIQAPIGSGSSGNVPLVVTKTGTGCGGIGKTIDINGGVDAGANCSNCDPREGQYGADRISDDRDFTLPVFADISCTDSYHNDKNSFLIKYPGTYDAILNGDFKLQEYINGAWQTIATLSNTSYGTPYNNNFFTGDGCQYNITGTQCTNVNYCGYEIDWNKVLTTFGEGTYRFFAEGGYTISNPYCLKSPPFCLKEWTVTNVDGTVKFETTNIGGTFGSVTEQGNSWTLCCARTQTTTSSVSTCSNGITWNDSIRLYGFFGNENPEFTRDQIKYATGAITKVRDEAIKTFLARTSQLPMWFHRRFYAYALMSDYLYVSDYNLNNDSYEYKSFWIVADGNYQIKHNYSTRYPKAIDFKFKEGIQYTFRDRCCSSNITAINPNSGTSNGTTPVDPPDGTRLFADLTPHLWSDLNQSKFS